MIFEWVVLTSLLAMLGFLAWGDFKHFSGERLFTRGEIIGHRTHDDGLGSVCIANVRYVDHSGTPHLIKNSILHYAKFPPVDASLPVVYPVTHPDLGRVPHHFMHMFIYAVLLLMLAGWVAYIAYMMGLS
jgi:hypothetical protein